MLEFTMNGAAHRVEVEPETPLLWVLRDTLGMPGTKYGCGIAQCGACTVLLGADATRSCSLAVSDAVGTPITTIEAIEQDPVGRRVVAAWVAHQVAQCGWASTPASIPDSFTSDAMLGTLKQALRQPGRMAEEEGDLAVGMAGAARIVEAEYNAAYLAHAQLDPPSALARFHADGALEVWAPNQAPEVFQPIAAAVSGLPPESITIHSPPLGGFFGRHLPYGPVLRRDSMPAAHIRIVESGEPMGEVGEPGLPGVVPAVANAVFNLTGQPIRSLPLSKTRSGTV